MKNNNPIARRDFMKSAAVITSGTLGLSMIPNASTASSMVTDERENVIGPREGFSLHVGTIVHDDLDAKDDIVSCE